MLSFDEVRDVISQVASALEYAHDSGVVHRDVKPSNIVINADGTGLRQLTRDKYAQLMPAWSPDGHTIAYVTDEGPGTNFTELSYGNFRIALFDLDLGRRELLPHMDEGRNISPQWAPDGKSFAFVSDRTGIANVFLYELGGDIYQLTNLFTGAQSTTPLSPALSWAQQADRLAFVYFENQNNDVYTIQNPRSLKREAWRPAPRADSRTSGTISYTRLAKLNMSSLENASCQILAGL